jgi:hypothetical protein
MVNSNAYPILVFYGILAIVCAALGNHFDKKNGFSNGYVVGTVLSLVIWFNAGRKMAGA